MPPRKDLGAILVDEDVLTPKDLERIARGSVAKDGARRPLWHALVDSELATPEQIFRALSARFGVPVVSDERLADTTPPDALKRALTRAEALVGGLVPIDLSSDGQRATVAMVDPSDEQTLAEFLTRAQVPEGRALLARRDAIVRAIERVWGEPTALVTVSPPLRPEDLATISGGRTPPQKRKLPSLKSAPQPLAPPTQPSAPVQAVTDDDVTGTVKLDPSLQAEISRLPARMTQADALTPLPQRRPKRPSSPAEGTSEWPNGGRAPSPAPTGPETTPARPLESPSEALRAEERLTRALIELVEALATELEARVVGGSGGGSEMARLSRRVARQLGLGRRVADEIGVAAQLFALDRAMRAVEGSGSADVFAELGWSAAGADGLLPMLRALTAASSGFGRTTPGAAPPQMPVGARIIGAVADYQELGAAASAGPAGPDLDTVSQLLRASPAGAHVVDALLRVLESDRGDKTPATPTMLPATSMLRDKPTPTPAPATVAREEEEEPPTPPPTLSDGDKTVRKPYPRPQTKDGAKGGE